MALTRIWLLRHGSTASNEQGRFLGWRDEPLSLSGRAEAQVLRTRISELAADHVWSSDLRRAVETARLAAGEPKTDPRLRELDFGELEGLTWDECSPSQRADLARFDGFSAPGGESVEQFRDRVLAFRDELGRGSHLLVTHGGVIRLLLRRVGYSRGVPPGGLIELVEG